MSTETFFNYKGFRWLWLNLAFLALLIVIYAVNEPIGGRNGGTVLGYTYGVLGAAGILYLMWFGIRKRSYRARTTTLKGCLAAHVWLGIALSIIVPLHAGFQFSWNVHTLTYLLMMIVVVSGIWGGIVYSSYAHEVPSHRGGGTIKKLLEQIYLLQKDIEKLSTDKQDSFMKLVNQVDKPFKATKWFKASGYPDPSAQAVTDLVASMSGKEQQDAMKLVSLASKKHEILTELEKEARIQNLLKLWLYIHLPLSIALLVSLAIHIFSVLYYW